MQPQSPPLRPRLSYRCSAAVGRGHPFAICSVVPRTRSPAPLLGAAFGLDQPAGGALCGERWRLGGTWFRCRRGRNRRGRGGVTTRCQAGGGGESIRTGWNSSSRASSGRACRARTSSRRVSSAAAPSAGQEQGVFGPGVRGKGGRDGGAELYGHRARGGTGVEHEPEDGGELSGTAGGSRGAGPVRWVVLRQGGSSVRGEVPECHMPINIKDMTPSR